LKEWRSLFDEFGVLTFSLQLGKNEVRGFSAWDEYAPMIAINTAYVEGARIFTLAHELGHLVTRTDAACFDWIAPDKPSDQTLERWCERFASAFLLPREQFSDYLAENHSITTASPVQDFDTTWILSRKLKVSARAMALALIDSELAPTYLYGLVERRANKIDRPPKREGGGGMRTVPKRLNQYGPRVSRSLVDAVNTGRLQRRDVADYLGMNLGDLQDLGDAVRSKPMVSIS
jgi:Zn-dependent peptidase ImmA (M78 family)